MNLKGDFFSRPYRRVLVACLVLGLVMRVGMVLALPEMGGDGPAYEQLAWNLAHNFSYSTSAEPPYQPSRVRSPGYPLFIAVIFVVAGRSQVAVRVTQAVLDTLTAFVIYLIARRVSCAATPAFAAGLALVLPFTAVYARYLLTEVLATFMTAVTLLIVISALDSRGRLKFLLTGTCLGLLILIRPDFALLPIIAIAYFAIVLRRNQRPILLAVALIGIGSVVVLAPWAIRNALVFGNVQPLALPGGMDGVQPTGFLAWVRTWHADLTERDRGVWPYWTQDWDRFEFPASAFDNDEERNRVFALLQRARTASLTDDQQAIEQEFAALARERAQRRPIRTWLLLPMRRAARLWINSRTEAFPLPAFTLGKDKFSVPMLAKLTVMLINLALLPLAVLGLWAFRQNFTILTALAGLIMYRTVFHAYWAGMEARYVLEAFPALYILAAEGIAWTLSHFHRRWRSGPSPLTYNKHPSTLWPTSQREE